jgi:hypothetical protein
LAAAAGAASEVHAGQQPGAAAAPRAPHRGPAPIPAVADAEAEAVLRRRAPPAREWLAARRAVVDSAALRIPELGAYFDAIGLGVQEGGGRGLVPNASLRRAHPDDPVYV